MFLTGLIATTCLSVAVAAWAAHHSPPVWAPDKTQVAKLADEPSSVRDYSFQAPPNWDPQTQGGPGKIGTLFSGPTDAQGNHPTLSVLIMGLPDWGIDKRTPADFLDLRLNNVKRMLKDWKPTKYENGIINGIPFARVHFTGTTLATSNKIAGFMYVGREGTYVIEIQGADSADKAATTLPLLEASAMTFKKVPKPLAMVDTAVVDKASG
jgi:hypothetical protein